MMSEQIDPNPPPTPEGCPSDEILGMPQQVEPKQPATPEDSPKDEAEGVSDASEAE